MPLGEAATLRFRVEGTGNLKWVDRGPEVTLGGARVYPPQQKSELRTTEEGISGSRTWEFVVVPQTTGDAADPGAPVLVLRPAGREGREHRHGAASPCASRAERSPPAFPRRRRRRPPPAAAPARCRCARISTATPHRRSRCPAARCSRSPASRSCCTPGCGFWAAAVGGPSRRRADGLVALRPRRSRRARAGRVTAPSARSRRPRSSRRALHEAFGTLNDSDDSERARAVRALLDDVRFVRYAPQLGDYSDKRPATSPRARPRRSGGGREPPRRRSRAALALVAPLGRRPAPGGRPLPGGERARTRRRLPEGDRRLRGARALGERERLALLELGPGRGGARGPGRGAVGAAARP